MGLFLTESLSAGLAVFEHRKKIKSLLRKTRFWLRKGTTKIIIFGPGGTGKTTLGRLLSDTFDIKEHAKYKESFDIEIFNVKNDVSAKLIIAPGQQRRRMDTARELNNRLSKRKTNGIINVVSYGYHSFSNLGYKELKQYKSGAKKNSVLNEYQKDSLVEEIKTLDEMIPAIAVSKKMNWMITLVAKQDLWWNNRIKVQEHYVYGEYGNKIRGLESKLGSSNFRHEYISLSFLISNFTSGKGELLATTSAGYDQNLQNANLEAFLNALNAFILK